MREIFHGELEQLGTELATMCGLAGDAMERATRSLLEADRELAEQVVAGDREIDALRARCENHAFGLLTLQAPVARDLRLVVTAIQAAEKIERMGDLARHVAETVVRRHPDSAIPPEMAGQFAEMGLLAERAARNVAQSIAAPRDVQFAQRERDDDRIDQLQRDILTAVHRPVPVCSVRTGIDVALLARFFERFADQAVSVTRRLDYIVTGAVPERPAAV